MYEDRTFEFLLNRSIERIKENYPNVDTREGSMIYNALAPEMLELSMAYIELNNLRNETFISTATREGKILRCIEQGIDTSIFDASYGLFKGSFNIKVPIGSRWNLDLYNYTVEEYLGENYDSDDVRYEFSLRSETLGTAPNGLTGQLTPISDTPNGLNYAEIVETLIEGENESSDQEIETYYFNYVNHQASDGNVEQYKQWCEEFDGIGNYKIFSLWNGANTVKVSILSTSNEAATPELIEQFQDYLDPGSTGMGDGKAPIGAIVTVTTASEVSINVSAKITLKDGYDNYNSVQPAIEEYLNQLAYKGSLVSYIGIGAAILNAEGVSSVSEVTVNGGVSDIRLADEQIPKLGTLDVEVIEDEVIVGD